MEPMIMEDGAQTAMAAVPLLTEEAEAGEAREGTEEVVAEGITGPVQYEDDALKPFTKWPRLEKRRFVQTFCEITSPANQNGKTNNLQFSCRHCHKRFMGQILTAMIHLTGVRRGGQRMAPCSNPPEDVKATAMRLFHMEGEVLDEDKKERKKRKSEAGNGLALSKARHVQTQAQMQVQARVVPSKPVLMTDLASPAQFMRTLGPLEASVLRFLSVCEVLPIVVESAAFTDMVRQLRAQPLHPLPTLKTFTVNGGADMGKGEAAGAGVGSSVGPEPLLLSGVNSVFAAPANSASIPASILSLPVSLPAPAPLPVSNHVLLAQPFIPLSTLVQAQAQVQGQQQQFQQIPVFQQQRDLGLPLEDSDSDDATLGQE